MPINNELGAFKGILDLNNIINKVCRKEKFKITTIDDNQPRLIIFLACLLKKYNFIIIINISINI